MKKVILILLIIVSISTVSVVAISLCNAKDIEYNASDTNWDVDTVEDALNDLYQTKSSCSLCEVSEPNLGDGKKLIPVIISDGGTITKINKNNPNWYNYCERRWANAVILNDDAPVPSDNQEIEMANIEAMFVWIPKYKYRLWNVGTGDTQITIHSIDIVFDTEDTVNKNYVSCKTPMKSNDRGECNNGEYMTHPSFISFGVNGFWVGKFETGYKSAQDTVSAQQDNNEPSNIIIKPNVYSWRGLTVKNMFEAAYNYEHGLESHMMKNTEWGAVAYLSHSKYGIETQVAINNNNKYKTGYAALSSTNQNSKPGVSGDDDKTTASWNTLEGYRASTTGNITGVYDMSGGSYEYVATHRTGNYGDSKLSQATLENAYETKYYETISSGKISEYQYMILGDAMGELGPSIGQYVNYVCAHWYNDGGEMIEAGLPWIHRGGRYDYGYIAGQFFFGRNTGAASTGYSFRLVLAPSN